MVDQFDDLLLGLLAALRLADQIDDVMGQHIAELVQGGQLAATLEAGIDGQNAPVVDRGLQEEISEVSGEHPKP